MRYKAESFLYNMVTAELAAYRTYNHMLQIDQLSNQLRDDTGRDDSLIYRYSEIVVLTLALTFNWLPDVPDELYSLETWWEKRKAGVPEAECLAYYSEHVPHWITTQYTEAINRALRIWTPPETVPESELTEEEKADPT